MERIMRTIRERLEEAKKQAKELRELIEFGKEVGLDVSSQEYELNQIEQEIELYEQALKKRGF